MNINSELLATIGHVATPGQAAALFWAAQVRLAPGVDDNDAYQEDVHRLVAVIRDEVNRRLVLGEDKFGYVVLEAKGRELNLLAELVKRADLPEQLMFDVEATVSAGLKDVQFYERYYQPARHIWPWS